MMYLNGETFSRDATEAARWFHKAAASGVVDAQASLGEMYAGALGVGKNSVKAVEWLFLAASRGSTAAQGKLGAMYQLGQGVSQDYIEAYAWLELAISGGNQQVVERKEFVNTRLSRNEHRVAERRYEKLWSEYAHRKPLPNQDDSLNIFKLE